jgi:hypothetical protein
LNSFIIKSRLAAGTLLAAVFAGCMNSDPIAVQSADPSVRVTASSTNSHGRNPNSQKYRDSGVKPGTGRSGSATLEVRAMGSQDGSVLLEATTGSLELGTSLGKIEKTQVKVLAGDTTTQNFNKLSNTGYWSKAFVAGPSRGTKLQVQANVSGIDPKRTSVVTATTTVARRPDITVQAVNGPAQIAPNAQVVFMAVLSEINGDLGARANCVLSVDGAPVSEAPGIWIDAAGTVTCQFSHVFTETGSHTIRVSATNVTPGDWDLSNNSASTSIEVRSAEVVNTIEYGGLYAVKYDWTQVYQASNLDGNYYRQESHQHINYTYAYLYGNAYGANAHSGGFQNASIKVWVAGVNVASTTLLPTGGNAYDDGSYFSLCQSHEGFISNTSNGSSSEYYHTGDWVQVCESGYHGDTASWNANYSFQKVTGDVLYYGAQTYTDYYSGSIVESGWHNIQQYGNGTQWNMLAGDEVRVQMTFTGLNGTIQTADRSVVLVDRSSVFQGDNVSVYYDNYYGATIQSRNVTTGTYLEGVLNF